MPKTGRPASIAWLFPAVWLLTGLVILLGEGPGGPLENPFFEYYLFTGLLLLGLACLVIVSLFAWRAGWSLRSALLVISVPGAFVALLALASPLAAIQTAHYFRTHLPTYEALVQELATNPSLPHPRRTFRNVPYIVDLGPPQRVAFPWPGGIIDNWSGVVFDPTALVLTSNRFSSDWSNWDDPRLATVKQLFGGDMTGCRQLAPSWFLCSFT